MAAAGRLSTPPIRDAPPAITYRTRFHPIPYRTVPHPIPTPCLVAAAARQAAGRDA